MERVLGPSLLRGEIDVDETEPSPVAESPLEIVEQRPHEIAAHWYPRVDRVEHRPEVAAQIGDPLLVADPPVLVDPIGEGGPVLEDVHRQIAAVALLRL